MISGSSFMSARVRVCMRAYVRDTKRDKDREIKKQLVSVHVYVQGHYLKSGHPMTIATANNIGNSVRV